ncbi:MAG TPA: protein-glutamate O-methyltransferase CheR [Gemmatimonadaceae bacterium]|jgi:chemotaxis methyl-accepting protein methylase|nr:protein-glutamate O-methyltransferase CheR [Gemmatimonadaceae bacterium]
MPGADPPDDGFAALLQKISRDRGLCCAGYKATCLRRRVGVRMRARAVHQFGDYAALLDQDAHEYDLLLDALTINVTRLFRNVEVYHAMLREVVAPLWAAATPRIRVWSAGCASGEEPYSLAVLFGLHAEAQGDLPRLSRVDILGTDIDRRSLEAAGRCEFDPRDFDETPAEWRSRFFQAAAPFTLDAALRRVVRFQRHDMLAEEPPRPVNDLIVCRNAIIYFDRASQDRLFDSFHAALAPGGFLVLGKVETLLGRARRLFQPVNGRERIFQRAE